MATKTVVNSGKSWIAKIAMTNGNPKLDTNVNIHLYTGTPTISRTLTVGGVTEIAYPGYALATLSGAVDGGIDANFWDTWTWPTVTFQATSAPGSPVTANGAFVTDSSNTVLLWIEPFAVPFTFTNSGDGFTMNPNLSFGSIFGN